MSEIQIQQILPKMTSANFSKIIRNVGISQYKILSSRSIVLYGQTKSRSDRSEALKELAKALSNYGAKFDSKSAGSGAGAVVIGQAKFILKPIKLAGSLILKPSFFGTSNNNIVDKEIPFGSYYNALIVAIGSTNKLSDEQKEVLISIAEYTQSPNPSTKSKMKKMMNFLGQTIQINTINNDYGESLGPLAIRANGLLPIDFKSAVVKIPSRSNEPLLDYIIKDKNREYKISAKSGTTTNTLKPGDVLSLIDGNDTLKKKWSKTPQYQIIKLLNEGSTKQGPITTAMWMKNNGFEDYFKWLKKDAYTEEVRQKCEDAIVAISREALDFTPIFKDATSSKVYYVKFRITVMGDSQWELVETPKDETEKKKTEKRVTFRSKNFVGRPKDKLGFQV